MQPGYDKGSVAAIRIALLMLELISVPAHCHATQKRFSEPAAQSDY